MIPPAQTTRRGFTLLELVVAVVLVAIMMGAVYAAMSSGMGSYRRSRAEGERDNMAAAAAGLLGQDLQRLTIGAPGGSPALVGVRDRSPEARPLVRLRVGARPAPGATDMRVDYFFVGKTPRDGELVRRSAPLHAGDGDGQVRYEIVAAGLRGVSLRYFDGQTWTDRWPTGRPGPPRLVELTLAFAGPRGRRARARRVLPVVVRAPLLDADRREGGP